MIPEALISVAVKSTGAGVTRALGWKATDVWKNRQHRGTLRELQRFDVGTFSTVSLPEDLDDSAIEKLTTFLESAEIQHAAMLLASSLYLGKCGSRDITEGQLRQHIRDLLHLHVGLEGQTLASCGNTIFDVLSKLVQSQADLLIGNLDGLPKATRVSLMKTSAAIAAAQVRNTELYGQLSDLVAYNAFEKSLRTQIAALHSTMRLPHAGTSRSVPYDRLFVQPRISVDPEVDELDSLNDLALGESRVVLLGDPGGGKSTSSLRFTHGVASGRYLHAPYRVPFFVPLKDYADRYSKDHASLLDYLHLLCETPYAIEAPEGAIEYFLLNGIAVVVFDGLDELLDTSLRRDIADAVEGFAHRYPTTQIVVTSRRVGYDEVPLDEDLFLVSSLEEFGEEQVANYALKWFNLDESIDTPSRTRVAESFLAESRYVDDLRTNPLMLSLMCGLYSGERYIPRNRPDVYEKCAMLLFEKWDKQRGINAPLPFDAGVQAAIRSLALWLYPQQSRSGIPKAELVRFMTDYLLRKRFDDPDEAEEAAISFIDFCRGRAWVLTDVGAELYWFTHQTFLEFFAASQLVRENASADSLLSVLESHIRAAEWDVVAQLAVQTLGKTVEDGADDFLERLILRAQESPHAEQINVVDFACRTLAFVVPRPDVLRLIVRRAVECAVHFSDTESIVPVVSLAERSAENSEMTGRYFSEELVEVVDDKQTLDRAVAIAFCYSELRTALPPSRSGRFGANRGELLSRPKLRVALDSLLPRARADLPWFAAREAWEGRMSVDEVVRLHGLRAFYTCDMGGMVLTPPPVWAIVQSTLSDHRTEPRKDFVEALYSSACQTPGPWLEGAAMEYRPIVNLGINRRTAQAVRPSQKGGQTLLRGLAILLILPLLEMKGREVRATPNGAQISRAPISRSRSLQNFLRNWGDDPQKRRTVDLGRLAEYIPDDALPIVKAWVSDEVSFSGGA